MTSLRLLFLGWVLSAAFFVSCKPDETLTVETGFQVQTKNLDFGRVQEFTTATKNFSLQSLSKSTQTITLVTSSPFSVQETLELPGGTSVSVPVSFYAGDTLAEGLLLVQSGDLTETIKLKGLGARPRVCVPSQECRVTTYDFPSDSCSETFSENGAPCTPVSLCLENGSCQMGQCVGVLRSCDDNNICTQDGCGESIGCVNSQVECTAPTELCKVAFCDPQTGCGITNAFDGTPCGQLDCALAEICFQGRCTGVTPPDGTPCAPKTPCQGEGTCQAQKCVRPPPGALVIDHSVPLPEAPAQPVSLLGQQGSVFFQTCGEGQDAGCHFFSVTGSGFERFNLPFEDNLSRQLIFLAPEGATFLTSQGLEARSAFSGKLTWSLPYASIPRPQDMPWATVETAPGRIARTVAGDTVAALSWNPWLPDAGVDAGVESDAGLFDGGLPRQTVVWVQSDGGVRSQQQLPSTSPSLVGSDYLERVFWYDSEGQLGMATPYSSEVLGTFPGENSLVVGHDGVWVGQNSLVPVDGGSAWANLSWDRDAGFVSLVENSQLLTRTTGYALYRACESPLMSCPDTALHTFLRAFTLSDGATLWESEVLSSVMSPKVVEAALLSTGVVAAVTQVSSDAGVSSRLLAYLSGREIFSCPFPSQVVPTAALFEANALHALVSHDGGWVLQTYDLGPWLTEKSGWPQRHGVSGTRQAR